MMVRELARFGYGHLILSASEISNLVVRILLLIIALVAHAARANPDWTAISQIPKETSTYRISHNNTQFQIGIQTNDKISHIHSTLFHRNTDQILHLPKSEHQRWLVVRPIENTGVEPTIQAEIISSKAAYGTEETVQLLSKLTKNWDRLDYLERDLLLQELRAAIENRPLTDAKRLFPSLTLTYVRLLLKQQNFPALGRFFESSLREMENLTVAERWQIQAIHCAVLLELGHFSEILKRVDEYNLLDPSLVESRELLAAEYWELFGIYGLAEVFVGMQSNDLQGISSGQLNLQEAINNVELIGDYYLQATLINKLNIPLHITGDVTQIEKNYVTALEKHDLAGVNRNKQHTLSNFSALKSNQGKYVEALMLNRLALESLPNNVPPNVKNLPYAHIAHSYYNLGDFERAERYFKLLSEQEQTSGRRDYNYSASLFLSRIDRLNGKPADAIERLNKLDFQSGSHQYYQHLSQIEIAHALLQLGRLKPALKALAEIESMPEVKLRVKDQLYLLLFKAELYRKTDLSMASQKTLLKVDDLLRKDANFPIQKLKFIQEKIAASAIAQPSNHIDAYYREGLDIIVQIFELIKGTDYGVGWRHRVHQFLSDYLDFIYARDDVSEHEKNAQFFEVWNYINGMNLHWRRRNLLNSEASFTDIKDLQHQIWELERQIVQVSAEERSRLQLLKNQLQEKVRYIHDAVANDNDSLAKDSSLRDARITLADAQIFLDAEQILLGIHVGQKQSYLLSLTNNDFKINLLPEANVLRDQIVTQNKALSGSLRDVATAMAGISKILPVAELINGYSDVFWLANNEMQQLSLSLFINKNDYSYNIIAINSIEEYWSEYRTIPSETLRFREPLSVFAASHFETKDNGISSTDLEQSNMRSWRNNLPDLNWVNAEANIIQRIYGEKNVRIFIDEHAISGVLTDAVFRHSQIAHIATHAYFHPDTPDITGLAVAPDKRNTEGFVSVSELISLPVYNDLVVLSGCETMLGKVNQGEGVFGLSRALLDNGAGATISTLWSVPDKATFEFMAHFYSKLEENAGDIPAALSYAQYKLKNHSRYRHPRNWAGFVLTLANTRYKKIQLNLH